MSSRSVAAKWGTINEIQSGRAKAILLAAVLLVGCARGEDYFVSRRREMVQEQLEARGIRSEAVLRSMTNVPREQFVPLSVKRQSYRDGPLPIGEGQTISQPYVVALMTESLNLEKGEKVLEIGTGSGYQAAVLDEMGCQVYSIEIVASLGRSARAALDAAGHGDVQTRIGDGYQGWPDQAPFGAIIVTCAPDHIPLPLVDQLREGGRMCIPVGPENQVQTLTMVRKRDGRMETEALIPVRFVPLTRSSDGSAPALQSSSEAAITSSGE